MLCGYCGAPELSADGRCTVCGIRAPAAAHLEFGKLRFLIQQIDRWELDKSVPGAACGALRRRYRDVTESFAKILREETEPLPDAEYVRIVIRLAGAAAPPPPRPATPLPEALPPVLAPTPAPALETHEPVEGIVFLTPTVETPKPAPSAAATEDEARRGAILARLYGQSAPAPSIAPSPPPPAPPRPVAPSPVRPVSPAPPPVIPPAPAEPVYVPLEPDLPLGERLKNLLTEGNVRILFNVGLSILFGGLAIFIRVYWNEYSRFQQIAYLAGGTAAAGIAGLLLRRNELLRTSGSYLLIATGICVPLDLFAWTEAGILPRAAASLIGLVTSAGCVALYTALLGWLRERVLAHMTVLAVVSTYAFALHVVGVDVEHLAAWMPLLFIGLTLVASAEKPQPEGEPKPEAAAPPEDLKSLLLMPARWAAAGGTPIALLVAFFQNLLSSGFTGPENFPSHELLLVSASAHAIVVRIRFGYAEVLWPAAFLNALALGLALNHWLPRADWGPWAMGIGALGMGSLVTVRSRIGVPSALPYLVLFYLMMGGALLDSSARFLSTPDASHAGRLMATLAWPGMACLALAFRPETTRYAPRALALLYVEAVLALFALGWDATDIASGSAVFSALFYFLGAFKLPGRLEPFGPGGLLIGYASALLVTLASLIIFLARFPDHAGEACQVAAVCGALAGAIAAHKQDAVHLGVSLIILLASGTALLHRQEVAWTQIPLWQAGACVLFAALGMAPIAWVSKGARGASHVAGLASLAVLGAVCAETRQIDNLAVAADLALLGGACTVHGVQARRADGGEAEAFEGGVLLLLTLAFRFLLASWEMSLTAEMTWLALPCVLWLGLPIALSRFPSQPYRTAGPAVAMLTASLALAVVLITPTFYTAATRGAALVFATTYGALFAVGSQMKTKDPWFEGWRGFLQWPSLALLGAAFVLGTLYAGIPEASISIPLALLGVFYVAVQRGTRKLPARPFCDPAAAFAVLSMGIALTLSFYHYAFAQSIPHWQAALCGIVVVATQVACALFEDPPGAKDGKGYAGAAAVCFAYPYVSSAFAATGDPALRLIALGGLALVYTLVERRTRTTALAVLAAPCGVMHVLALIGLNVLGAWYGAEYTDARLTSLSTGIAAALLTYYAFAASPPAAFPPVLSATGSALLFTVSYALLLFHYSTGSDKGGLAFLGSTYVLGIVALALRHQGKAPQWKPYFAVSLLNSAMALALALPHATIRAWVLFGLSLLYGGYGIVLETELFTYLACFALSGAYLSLLQSVEGIQSKHYVFWVLALAMGKTVAGGFLAKKREDEALAGAPAKLPKMHPAFHVGVGLSFLAIGMALMNASLYFKVEYWLAIGAAWACGVVYLLAWLISRRDVYLYLSAMTIVGSYFVWLQNQEISSWEWYTLPIGVLGISWARTLGARRLDPEQTRIVDILAVLATIGPSVVESMLSSLRTANAALAFVLSVVVLLLGMTLKRKLYLVAGLAGVILEMVVQVVHLIDFSSFGPVHYFIMVGVVVTLLAMVLSYFVSKSMQARASEARERMRTWFAGWE